MLSRLTRLFTAAPLPNTGSVARDLLASERTFLAWTRTGLTFIALGVALEKVEAFAELSPTLLHLNDSRTKLAAGILVATGSLTIGHGTVRYYGALDLLQQGKFRPNTGGVALLAATSVAIALAGATMVLENDRKKVSAEKAGSKANNDGVEKKERLKVPV
jgi:uncharacterized membrane protein YidH (DUF202 family)